MSPATQQATEIEELEQQVEEARAERAEAEERLDEHQASIREHEAEAQRCSRAIREKHREGVSEGIRELRQQRREAKAAAEDLRDETPTFENILSRLQEAEQAAEKKLIRARGELLAQDAREAGEAFFETLERADELAAGLEELRADLDRVRSTLRHTYGEKGPFPSPAFSAAGVEPLKDFMRELREQVRRWRARREQT